MLSCYHCKEKAHFLAKPTNQLFCSAEHHTLYNEGWSQLLQSALFRERAFYHLGMKRAAEAEGEPVIEPHVLIELIEMLPQEIVVEILLFSYAGFESTERLMREVFALRETSKKLMYLIDTFLIGAVKELSNDVEMGYLDDTRLALFTSLRSLTCTEAYTHITDVGLLAVSAHLEELYLYDDRISNDALCQMTTLRKLEISEGEYHERNHTLSALTQLEILKLDTADPDEQCFAFLPNLRELYIGEWSKIDGHNLCYLTALEKLEIVIDEKPCKIDDDVLRNLPDSLRILHIHAWGAPEIFFTGKGIANLTMLKELVVRGDGLTITDKSISKLTALDLLILEGDAMRITDDGLLPLANIKKLILYGNDQFPITDRGISNMSGLTSIYSPSCQFITLEQLFSFRATLEVFTVQNIDWMNWDTLLGFPLLKTLYIPRRILPKYDLNPAFYVFVAKLRDERGIKTVLL